MQQLLSDVEAAARAKAKKRAQARAAFLRQTARWHWISAAICLVGMMLFAATGVTLNHADIVPASPRVTTKRALMPPEPLAALRSAQESEGPLPDPARGWIVSEMGVRTPRAAAIEWSANEAYIALPRPSGDAWLTVDTQAGEVEYESTSRGPVAYLNDLHKGRNGGLVWKYFLDVFAGGALVFCITGLILLQMHSQARKSTWPLVGLGLLAPLVLVIIFIH